MRGRLWLRVVVVVALAAASAVGAVETRAEAGVRAQQTFGVHVNGVPVRLRRRGSTLVTALRRVGIDPVDGVLRSAVTATVLDPLYHPAVVTVNGVAVSMDSR